MNKKQQVRVLSSHHLTQTLHGWIQRMGMFVGQVHAKCKVCMKTLRSCPHITNPESYDSYIHNKLGGLLHNTRIFSLSATRLLDALNLIAQSAHVLWHHAPSEELTRHFVVTQMLSNTPRPTHI